MNLIIIYGPPAAGKLTVSKELSKTIQYKVFHNHTIIGCISDIFPYGDEKLEPILKRLSVKFRLEIFEEAAMSNTNMITTYGGGGKQRFKFFRKAIELVNGHKGSVLFVQLIPKKEVLFRRVQEESRKDHKIDSKEFLEKLLDSKPEFYDKFPDITHLTIDNSDLSPKEVACQICSYYKLS